MTDGPLDVDAALADLALVAVARLQIEMSTAKNPRDRIAAANSILDRLGFSRTTRAQADTADREIRRAIGAALKGTVSESTAKQLGAMAAEKEDRERPKEKKLTRNEQLAIDIERFEAAKAEEDARIEAEFEAAAPDNAAALAAEATLAAAQRWARGESEELANARDFSELGDDGEETDKWLDA